jgi:hypothetical protein
MTTDDREIRELLEQTQEKLKGAEERLGDVERARALAAARAAELETQATALKERVATLEEHQRLGRRDAVVDTLGALKARLEAVEGRLRKAESVSPRLPRLEGVCSRCGSTDIVPAARVVAQAEQSWRVAAAVDTDPGAAFFKAPVAVQLSAAVCAKCGAVELHLADPATLVRAWQTALSRK